MSKAGCGTITASGRRRRVAARERQATVAAEHALVEAVGEQHLLGPTPSASAPTFA
jgi:hypothetical protein